MEVAFSALKSSLMGPDEVTLKNLVIINWLQQILHIIYMKTHENAHTKNKTRACSHTAEEINIQICPAEVWGREAKNYGKSARRSRQDAICSDVAVVLTPGPIALESGSYRASCHVLMPYMKSNKSPRIWYSNVLSMLISASRIKVYNATATLHHLDQTVCPVSSIFTICISYTRY